MVAFWQAILSDAIHKKVYISFNEIFTVVYLWANWCQAIIDWSIGSVLQAIT